MQTRKSHVSLYLFAEKKGIGRPGGVCAAVVVLRAAGPSDGAQRPLRPPDALRQRRRFSEKSRRLRIPVSFARPHRSAETGRLRRRANAFNVLFRSAADKQSARRRHAVKRALPPPRRRFDFFDSRRKVNRFQRGTERKRPVADELLAADSLMVFENGQYSVLESATAENIVITVGKVGYTSEEDAQKAGVVVKIAEDGAPAEGYLSLADAVAAVPTDNIQKTIVFLGGEGTKVSAPGVRVFDGQNIVIDFNRVTFDVTDTVGSPNTETNGFQLNKGATVVMKNGTLTSKTAKILIQQYCELTVEDMKLDMSACPQVQYVISNNHGTTTITGDTTIVAAPNQVAFDVYYGLSTVYAQGVTVVFDENFTGSVKGKVEYGAGSAQTEGWTEKANLQIENGTFDITFSVNVVEETEASVSISGGSFTNVPTAEYIADASALYTDGTNYAVAAEDTAPSGMEKVIFTDSEGNGYASLAAAAGVETLYLYLDLDALTVNPGEEAVIDLNGHNLTYTGTSTIIFNGSGKEATITDTSVSGSERGGTLNITGERDGAQSVFEIGATLNVSNINIDSTGCVFYPRGSTAKLNITNCDITTTGIFCVATNAGDQAYYGVTINIADSSLTAAAENYDDCAIMMNVSGSLNIEKSVITGDRQGLFVRAGDVTVVNSEIVLTGNWATQNDENAYHNEDWQSGNEAPSAAIVAGN